MNLSIVAASRNDDHGGSMLERMRVFVKGLDAQAKRHGMDAELIIVEWNPPDDRPRLSEVLPAPASGSPLTLRFITVPNEIHRRWDNWKKIPLFQMIAKNVGIRRAKGAFILATNVDLLFSDALCEFLARGEFQSNAMYRANRCDVSMDVLNYDTLEEQLAYCESNIIRRIGLMPPGYGKRFQRLRQMKFEITRRVLAWRGKDYTRPIDTDACGDFTLMSRVSWERIKGYVELGLYSIYVDALGCHAAVACGVEQVILPPECCAYHADHGAGWMSMSVIDKMRFTAERPSLDWALVRQGKVWMHTQHEALAVNDDSWGCADVELEEKVFTG